MTFEFKPAVRENVQIIIALAGASGSGKTKTALELAVGLAGGDESKIGMIDTEAKRGLHYARTPGATAEQEPEKYGFMHSDMLPPFRPARFEEGISAAESAGLKVLIVDSFSHEYDGEGGIMDWADELEEKGVKSPGNWKDPKGAHKHLVQTAILQARCHLIFCLRAEEKIKILKRGDQMAGGGIAEKTVIEQMGWMPICEKRFMFEMTMSLTLRPDQPGIPQFDLPHKMQDQHRPFFPEGQRISRESGKALAQWAAGGRSKATAPKTPAEYETRLVAALARATDAAKLGQWWNSAAEKTLRADLAIPDDDLKGMMAKVTARVSELKSQASASE